MMAATLSGGRADRSMTRSLRAARLLGWASLGLAAAMLAAPGRVARPLGLEGKEKLIRLFGAQELLAGTGALSVDAPAGLWLRAGGDAIHIGTVAPGLLSDRAGTRRAAAAGVAVLMGFLVVDTLVAAALTRERRRERERRQDYSNRSGFPGGVERARGAARDFATPADLRAALAPA